MDNAAKPLFTQSINPDAKTSPVKPGRRKLGYARSPTACGTYMLSNRDTDLTK